jgi:hypothetical protein
MLRLLAWPLLLAGCGDTARQLALPTPILSRGPIRSVRDPVTPPPGWTPRADVPRFATAPTGGTSGPVTINFEEVADGAAIGDFYRDRGIVFTSGIVMKRGGTLVNWITYPPRSGVGVGSAPEGAPDISFTFPSTATEVGVYITTAKPLTFTCYAQDGTTIGKVEPPSPNVDNHPWSVAPPHYFAQVKGSGISRCALTGASQYYTIDDLTFVAADAVLACTPNPVERGKTVRCAMTPSKPYKVTSRRATGQGFAIAETLNASFGANAEYVWEGVAVANTQVEIDLQTSEGGATKNTTYTADFQVTSRDWPKLVLDPPSKTINLRGRMREYPSNGVFGNAKAETPAVSSLAVTRPTTGPNTGLAFLSGPFPNIRHTIFMHPVLYASPPPQSQAWLDDQDGSPDGTCTKSVISTIRTFSERHEGLSQASNSHWGITSRFYRDSDVEQRLEEVYRPGDEAALRTAVASVFRAQHDQGPHKDTQNAFDTAEYAVINAALGCLLDTNLKDP